MKSQIAEGYVKSYLLLYLWFSLLLSLVIFLKLLFASSMGLFNIVLYDIYYYVMPSIAIFTFIFVRYKSEMQTRWQRLANAIIWVSCVILVSLLLLLIDCCFNNPFSYIVFPLVAIFVLCFHLKKSESKGKLLSKKMVATVLSIVILMPYAVAFLGFNSALSGMRAMQNENDRVEFVSEFVHSITTSFWGLRGLKREYSVLHRASSDFLKFLMVGVGSCGEMAHATKAFLDNLDLESRVVSFPGEDHMFVEVKLNGTWLVVDPGYGLNLVTREERGSKRLRELGGLSYVVAYTDQGPIEVTKHYVTTDQIIIRVTDGEVPIANARVILKHTFMGNTRSLPEFYSDANGTVKLSLGPLTYNNSKIEPVEPHYWIWVNNRNTNLKVSSTGSGKSVLIELNLAETSWGN
jgi:hypothetical protein